MEDKPLEQMVPLASLRGIQFSFMLAEDMEKFSVIDITEASDVTSSKLGLPNASLQCGTCGSKNIKECEGHNGIIRLPATIYHPYYVSEIVQILNRICPGCKSVKQERRIKDSFTMDPSEKNMREGSYNLERFYKTLSRNDQRMFLKLLKSKFSLPTRTSAVRGMKFDATYLKKCSKIQKTRRTSVSKNSGCKYCSRSSTKWYPALKFKSSSEGISGNKSISIVAEINEKIPKRFQNKSLSEVFPTDYWNFVPTYPHQRGSCVKKLSLSPSQVFHILKQLDKGFIEQFVPERELLFLSCLPVTPNCHRVTETSHVYADGPQLSYDERTKACRRVVDISKKLSGYRHHEKFGVLAPSYTASRVLEYLKTSKKVFDCGRPRKYMDRTVSLFLSKKLERWAYGYEYGALEVKTHLEKVSFSDVVTSVMIFYAGREVQGTKFTPWISHFHLSKERMMRKRLKVQHIIDELSENYNSVRAKADEILPRLCIINKVCSSVDLEKEKDDTVCITVSVETSESNISLDFIRDMLIPLLLRTKIKGFVEFKKVDILCDAQDDHHAGLFLKVTLSENCPLEKFWGILQDACIPIMDLIDWDCSHPNSIYDIFSVFGIDVAWMYFLKSLKMAASDTGRNIRREHLVMVANRLSVTGEFHGLTSKGLQQQIDHASISAPFLQACFVNPRKNFINAAKQGSMDKLFGTVDAMAWGKEAPIGTGGSFDIIYSGKIYTPEKLDNIYETVGIDKLQQNPMETSIPSCQNICNKRKGQLLDVNGHSTPWQLISNDQKKKQYARKWENRTKGQMLFPSSSRDKEHRSLGFKSNSFSHKFRSSDEVVDMHSSLRAILHCYQINEYLNEVDKLSVMDALVYHPKGDAKRGIGIQDIKVGQSPTHQGSRCFILIRDDGTSEDFSYRKCVVGYAKKISPEAGSIVERELTHRR